MLATMSVAEQLEMAETERKQMAGELVKLKKQLSEAREAAQAAEARDAESQRLLLATAEMDRDHKALQRAAARHILQQGLARGFNAWAELHFAQKRNAQLLKQYVRRMMRPKLAACFSDWWRDWQARQAKLAVLGAQGVQQETERERRQLEEELTRLKQV